MPRGTQLTVVLENKPGQLAKLAAALKKAQVNILAISVVDSVDTGVIRMVVDSPAKAKQALTRAKITVTQQLVLIANLPNEPGALQGFAARLSAAGVNINYVYGSVTRAGAEGLIVLGVDKLGQALKIE
ncbi:MAG: ACT domain-containing protein [Armatimonadetes bacterium]|nr:ACT domain-containing protein [Armatimonadota bacterium]